MLKNVRIQWVDVICLFCGNSSPIGSCIIRQCRIELDGRCARPLADFVIMSINLGRCPLNTMLYRKPLSAITVVAAPL